MIVGRYQESTLEKSKKLPAEWTENFVRILAETYKEQANKDNSFFDVYGLLFDNEVMTIVSYVHHSDHSKSPITLFLSHDIPENSKKTSSVLNNLVDFSGLVFDDIFSQKEWNDFVPNWTENSYKSSKYFYKITRENFSLTLQAEEILNSKDKEWY